MNTFDAIKNELEGAWLLEASAGTGKTYTLTLLTLRLIVEKGLSINEILLVTFTINASAEMKDRIRIFINEGLDYLQDNKEIDSNIQSVIDLKDKLTALQRLSKAKNELDQLQVFTIHSFLYQTIQEFAFETGMRFNYDLVNDQKEWVEQAIKQYWRKNISPLSEDKLTVLLSDSQVEGFESKSKPLSFELLVESVQCLLNNWNFPEHFYSEEALHPDDWEDIIEQKNETIKTKKEDYDNIKFEIGDLEKYSPDRLSITNKNAQNAYKNNQLNYFKGVVKNNRNQYQTLIYEMLSQEAIESIKTAIHNFNIKKGELYTNYPFGQTYVINSIIYQCYLSVKDEIDKLKERDNVKQTDDLVRDFYDLIQNEETRINLQNTLSKRYKAFFIDEFQDTDSHQIEIFSNLFDENTVQFYVGDPKQSIYGFRGADIDSYVNFKQNFKNLKTASLATNYRSTASFVDSCNRYFKSEDNFFQKDGIEYIEVKAHNQTQKGNIHFLETKDKDTHLQKLVIHLLKNCTVGEENQRVQPKNIAILTTSNKNAKEAKQALARIKVPAVILNEQSVFESAEAKAMLYFLELLTSKNKKDFKRLLITSWFNTPTDTVQYLDYQKVDDKLFKVYDAFEKKGLYVAFQEFNNQFQLEQRIQNDEFPERVQTNTNQLVEICHKWSTQEKLSIYSVIKKLYNNIQSPDASEEYEELIESDRPAVQIMTIHKSKGLQFDIVICPELPKTKNISHIHSTNTFKINGKRTFLNTYYKKPEGSIFHNAFTQTRLLESRRLEYVLITRAVQDFYGFTNKNTPEDFINNELNEKLASINPKSYAYSDENASIHQRERLPHDRIDKTVKFSVASFSDLSIASHPHYTVSNIEEEGYDQFIFNKLKKGADAGNLIHELFETFNFDNNDIDGTLDIVSKKYPSYLINKDNLHYYKSLMNNVLNAQISELPRFKLADLSNDQRICEMAFHWKPEKFKRKDIEALLKEDGVRLNRDVENGYIKGFIDFIFEHQGKYYILDWKSNHIGSSIDDYTQDKMEIAMQGNNYHLQHFIYKQAFLKYLSFIHPEKSEQEISDLWGGVIYSFVRGCRENKSNGMYYHE